MSKEIFIVSLYIAIIAYVAVTRKKHYRLPAAVALGLATTWTLALGDLYYYNTASLTLASVNLYALSAWAAGLLIGYMLYSRARRIIKWRKSWQKLILFNLIYIPLLLAVETIAYHTFNVVNVGTSMYAGLPICDCIHAPAWMQLSYLIMGTVYLISVWFVDKISHITSWLPKVA